MEPAEREIEAALGDAGLALDAALHRRLRFDQAVNQAVSDARTITTDARRELSGQTDSVNRQTTISILPVLIVYVLLQKRFVAGAASAAVKG